MSSTLLWEAMTLQKKKREMKKRRRMRSEGSRIGDRKGTFRIGKEETGEGEQGNQVGKYESKRTK